MPKAVCMLAPPILVALLCSAALPAEESKPPSYKGPVTGEYRSTFHPLADVPEQEPNGSAAEAQFVGCGNSLNPASLANTPAARDTDWVSFNAGSGDLLTLETGPQQPDDPEVDTIISLISDTGTVLASNDDFGNSLWSRIESFPAPYTGLYYLRIRGFSGAEGIYRANVACEPAPPPPKNDVCAGAIKIGCGEIAISGSTAFAHDDYDLCPGTPVCESSCTGFHSPGKDVVYRLEIVGAGDNIDVTYDLNPRSTDGSIYIVTDCANVQASCVAGQDSPTGAPPEELVYTFPAPGVYYLILDAFTSGGADFTLNGVLQCATSTRPQVTWGRLKAIYR